MNDIHEAPDGNDSEYERMMRME